MAYCALWKETIITGLKAVIVDWSFFLQRDELIANS